VHECLTPVILEHSLGPDHPDVAISYGLVVDRFAGVGRDEEAERYFQRSLAAFQRALETEHGRQFSAMLHDYPLRGVLNDHVALLRKLDRQAEAEAVEGQMNDIESHPTAMKTQGNTAPRFHRRTGHGGTST
jgi:hypothetical protein